MKEETKYVVIVTLLAVLLCAMTIFVGIKICDIINERDALKEQVSDIAATEDSTKEEFTSIVEVPADETFNTDEMTFVEESTNGVGEKAKVYKDKDGNAFTFSEDGRLIRTMSRPGAMGKDVAMDVDDLLDIAHAYMVDTYGADFESFAYAAIHNNMTTGAHKSYLIQYQPAPADPTFSICLYDKGLVLWSQFSDTSDVQIVE